MKSEKFSKGEFYEKNSNLFSFSRNERFIVITEATGNIETGNNSDTLDDYLEENDYPTLSEYDEQVQDIVDYVNENS